MTVKTMKKLRKKEKEPVISSASFLHSFQFCPRLPGTKNKQKP